MRESPSVQGSPPPTSSGQALSNSIACRRCNGTFERPDASVALPSCPHCGAAVRPLWSKVRNNRNAAVLALLALPVLTAAVFLPFISISKLGHERIMSLMAGIRELFERGYLWLGLLLLVFSVVFPFAKLLAILVATSSLLPLSDRLRHGLTHLAHITGRYSLLDILVVAIMIVVVKFDGLAEVKAETGTALFTVAVFLSIAAGMLVNFDHLGRKTPSSHAAEPAGH